MPGYSSVPVIADAYLKGFTGFNAEEALTAMKATATYERQNGVPYVLAKDTFRQIKFTKPLLSLWNMQ